MLRQILVAAFVMAAACGTADAGDHFRLYHPGVVYAPSPYYVPVYPAPVVYAAPVVHYPAPVLHYPAPVLVHPVAVATAPAYYGPWIAPAALLLRWLPRLPSLSRRRNRIRTRWRHRNRLSLNAGSPCRTRH